MIKFPHTEIIGLLSQTESHNAYQGNICRGERSQLPWKTETVYNRLLLAPLTPYTHGELATSTCLYLWGEKTICLEKFDIIL